MPFLQSTVLIPAIPVARVNGQLNKFHSLFHEAASHEALCSVGAGVVILRLKPVELLDGIRLFRDIRDLRHGHLHAIGHLVVLYRRRNDIGIGASLSELVIDLTQKRQLILL